MPFVPIIIGIPYTVPCACASRETVCTGRQDPGARSAERARVGTKWRFAVRAPERDSAEWVERRQQRKVPRLCRANEVSSAPLSC